MECDVADCKLIDQSIYCWHSIVLELDRNNGSIILKSNDHTLPSSILVDQKTVNDSLNPNNNYSMIRTIRTYKDNDVLGVCIVGGSNTRYPLTISHILSQSLMIDGLFKVGDVILAIDSLDIRSLTHEEVIDVIKNSGSSVEITILQKKDANGSVLEESFKSIQMDHSVKHDEKNKVGIFHPRKISINKIRSVRFHDESLPFYFNNLHCHSNVLERTIVFIDLLGNPLCAIRFSSIIKAQMALKSILKTFDINPISIGLNLCKFVESTNLKSIFPYNVDCLTNVYQLKINQNRIHFKSKSLIFADQFLFISTKMPISSRDFHKLNNNKLSLIQIHYEILNFENENVNKLMKINNKIKRNFQIIKLIYCNHHSTIIKTTQQTMKFKYLAFDKMNFQFFTNYFTCSMITLFINLEQTTYEINENSYLKISEGSVLLESKEELNGNSFIKINKESVLLESNDGKISISFKELKRVYKKAETLILETSSIEIPINCVDNCEIIISTILGYLKSYYLYEKFIKS